MPVLEALERVLSSPVGPPLIPLLGRMAPCWFAQIPWLLSENEPAGLQSAMMNAPRERMLREIGAFLESLATRSTIVLLLEDLHWSDNATVDLLSFLAERRDPARLVVIGTYRPAEASIREHAIRRVTQTLRSRRRCFVLALDYLSAGNVREYLQRRFGDDIQDLAPLIHTRTDGNPLFVVAIVEEMIRRGQLANTGGGWVVRGAANRIDLAVPDDLGPGRASRGRGIARLRHHARVHRHRVWSGGTVGGGTPARRRRHRAGRGEPRARVRR
jgi:predicted ATPase